MDNETVDLYVKEHVKLEKFDGAMVGQPPVEVLEIEDGRIISHVKAKEKEL